MGGIKVKIFKKAAAFLAAVFIFTATVISGMPVKAAVVLPKVKFIGFEHSPLMVGDKETIYLSSDYSGQVQYRVYLYTENTKKYEELTRGYSKAVKGNSPYTLSPGKTYALGKYKVIVYVRRSGVTGAYKDARTSYDTQYTAFLSCVPKSSNRIYGNGDMEIEKDVYSVGEKVVVNGIKDIGVGGMPGPYYYKLHIFNVTTGKWTNDVLPYRSQVEWTPTEPGQYVLDVWAVADKSTYLSKANADPAGKYYQVWKLKAITVKSQEKYIKVSTDTQVMKSSGGEYDERWVLSGQTFAVYDEINGYYRIKAGKIYGYIPVENADVLQSKPADKVTAGWQNVTYDYGNPALYDDASDYANRKSTELGLKVLSPTWMYVKGDITNPSSIYAGEIIDREYVRRAHANGYEVWPMFSIGNNNLDPATASKLANAVFTNVTVRNKVMDEVIDAALEADADGINIDFEALGSIAANKDGFTAFVKDLSAKLRAIGVGVSVDITVPVSNSIYSSFYDRPTLAQYADYLILMGYDEHYSTSAQPGSMGSYPWVNDAITKIIAQGVSANKLVLGAPFYTRDYGIVEVTNPVSYNSVIAARGTAVYSTMSLDSASKLSDISQGQVLERTGVSPDGKWYTVKFNSAQAYIPEADVVAVPANGKGMWVFSSESLKMPEAMERVNEYSGSTEMDNNAKQMVATYYKDGIKHVIWLETLDSMNWRIDLANQYGLKGAAAWKLGDESPEIWDAFNRLN
jgi:spore germination protein YaaH